jgi:ABC-type sugar transport system ATPase subunit
VVEVVEAMGFEAYAHGRIGGAQFIARLEGDAQAGVHVGDTLALDVVAEGVHLFDATSGATLARGAAGAP